MDTLQSSEQSFHENEMTDILRQIKVFYDVQYFHSIQFFDHHFTVVSSKPDLVNILLQDDTLFVKANTLPAGIYKIEDVFAAETLEEVTTIFNYLPGYLVVIYKKNYIQHFYFAGHKNKDLNYLFNNKYYLINEFIQYFYARTKKLITSPKNYKLKHSMQPEEMIYFNESEALFLDSLDMKRYYIPHKEKDIYLSKKEKKLLELSAQGLTSKEAADLLFLSQESMTTYRKRILQKMGAKNMTNAVYLGGLYGIIIIQ